MKKERHDGGGFPRAIPRPVKRTSGRTSAGATPLSIRASRIADVDEETRAHVRRRIARQLGKFATHIERATVRFDDVNGLRGGVDTACRIKVTLSNLPSVVLDERAATGREAFDRAANGVERAVRRALGRSGLRTPKTRDEGSRSVSTKAAVVDTSRTSEDGSLIGRRVGRSRANLLRAAERPEKIRRDVPVDTAQPGISATDRKVGKGATAKRNTKLNTAGLTVMLEDSQQDRPSRKSTRRSTNRAKPDSNLRRRETRRVRSPKARAARAAARGASVGGKGRS